MVDTAESAPIDPDRTEPIPEPRRDDAADDHDLRESLTSLAGLSISAGQQGLEDMLRHVGEFAVRAIPGADGAGVTLLESDRADTIVASAEFVRAVDAVQYGLGEGPSITAARDRCTVTSASLSDETRWPRFGPQVARMGVHSALSLPLLGTAEALGAMNVYAHARNAFDDRSVELGELYAIPAAVSVQNAQLLSQARRLAGQLQEALTSRATIDQAIGIVRSRSGCTPDEAFAKLRGLSQSENRKLIAVAQQIVDDAVRRAQARRASR